MLSNLNQPLRTLPGIGLKREKVLENAGIATVGDLLLYLPYRYIDRSTEVGISHLPLDGEVTAVGEIVSMQTIPGKRRRFVMTVEDQTGSVACTWFGGIQYLKNAYRGGRHRSTGRKIDAIRAHPANGTPRNRSSRKAKTTTISGCIPDASSRCIPPHQK